MTRRERAHLLRVLRGTGLELIWQPRKGYYVARCPSCSGRLEIHTDAPSPDLAIICRGRVDGQATPKEAALVH